MTISRSIEDDQVYQHENYVVPFMSHIKMSHIHRSHILKFNILI